MYRKSFLAAFTFTGLSFVGTWLGAQRWNLVDIDVFGTKLPHELWALPALSLALLTVMYLLQFAEFNKENYKASSRTMVPSIVGTGLTMLFLQAVTVLRHGGVLTRADGSILALAVLWCLLLVIGNYITTTRQGLLTGLPTPWALKSELSWAKTHRLLGRSWIFTVLLSMIAWATSGTEDAMTVAILGIFTAIGAAIIYSYFVWKNDPARS